MLGRQVWIGRRRSLVGGVALAGLATSVIAMHRTVPLPRAASGRPAATTVLPMVTVFKDPACGCCRAWVERMRAAGFEVQVRDIASAAERDGIKRQHGVTPALAACHTAIVGDYVVEGHVPPELIKRLLAKHPKVTGLAVPGMPAGSPGMEGMGTDHYDVLTFRAGGTTQVYEKK